MTRGIGSANNRPRTTWQSDVVFKSLSMHAGTPKDGSLRGNRAHGGFPCLNGVPSRRISESNVPRSRRHVRYVPLGLTIGVRRVVLLPSTLRALSNWRVRDLSPTTAIKRM